MLNQLFTVTVVKDSICTLHNTIIVVLESMKQVFFLVERLANICSVHLSKHRCNNLLYLLFKCFDVASVILIVLLLEVFSDLGTRHDVVIAFNLSLEISGESVFESFLEHVVFG